VTVAAWALGADSYELRLRAHVAQSLAALPGGAQYAELLLSELFATLPGYWPADVLAALDEVARVPGPTAAPARGIADALRRGPAADPDLGDPMRLLLPVPHPLDADWRFAPAARERLLEQASASAPGACVLLGTPTLFPHSCAQPDRRAIVLVDRSPATVDAARALVHGHDLLRVVRTDLVKDGAGVEAGEAGVVVADPPWYRPEQQAFLRAAARALHPDGTLLMAASPAGSRPTAPQDRELLLADAEANGLRLLDAEPGALHYTSSPFERAALTAAGAPGTPTDWRRADLLVFARDRSMARPARVRASAHKAWPEVAFGRVRVRTRPASGAIDAPRVRPAVPGAVSASVSRRSRDRVVANLWTTGNGAWTADGPPEVVLDAVRTSNRRLPGVGDLRDALDAEQCALQAWGWA